jgi:hypothetical protein
MMNDTLPLTTNAEVDAENFSADATPAINMSL